MKYVGKHPKQQAHVKMIDDIKAIRAEIHLVWF